MADGQSIAVQRGVLARKIARAPASSSAFLLPATTAPDVLRAPVAEVHARAWRLALARAARDQLKMALGFTGLTQRTASLTEVLENPMQRALILMVQGRGDGMGLMIISGQMLAAMIEMLTLTHLSRTAAPALADLRRPTRTDAAMAVEFVDAALAGFEGILAESGCDVPADWAAGYRYAAFIDDPRPLHLMLEDDDYHLLVADLALEDGARSGQIILALPVAAPAMAAAGAAATAQHPPAKPVVADTFQADLTAQVANLAVQIDAALAQISIPLERVMRLSVGDVFALPQANLDQISLLGRDGQRVASARLGQNRGMRALRLTDVAMVRGAPVQTFGVQFPQSAARLDLSNAPTKPPFGGGIGADHSQNHNQNPNQNANQNPGDGASELQIAGAFGQNTRPPQIPASSDASLAVPLAKTA